MRASVGYQNVTIADSGTVSDGANLGGHTLVGVILPAGWTTSAISFQGSYDGTNYFALEYEGTAISYAAVAASKWQILPPEKFFGIPYIKVVSADAQAAGDIIVLISRPL